jgi:FAD/FMN-containing dehydrogenase
MTQVVVADLDAFRRSFTGQVIAAPGADYDSARSVWNGCFDQRPAAVARCFSSADVAAAIAFARQQNLEISVRGGGHSVSGVSAADGSLMIDLSRLREVVVDPAARRARCGGGTTGADLDAACQQHGLAVTTGTISHIGVAGLTLGGGVGWLRAMMGLSMDNLVAAELVLADGRCVRASEDDHPDLFWALRGGGGNFGVVMNFEYQLQPVGPEVHVGLFFWGIERSVEALRLCRDVVADLPRDASSLIAAGLSAPRRRSYPSNTTSLREMR